MTEEYERKRRCSQCEDWSSVTFDSKVDTERIKFAESNVIPDPKEMISQNIVQAVKTGLCRKCMIKELEAMKESPDNAIVRVSFPSNGGMNA